VAHLQHMQQARSSSQNFTCTLQQNKAWSLPRKIITIQTQCLLTDPYAHRYIQSRPAHLLLKKWPWKELILSPLLQRMRITASQAVGRVRLRRSSADSFGPSRPAWKDG
jgi:hypothetical protein